MGRVEQTEATAPAAGREPAPTPARCRVFDRDGGDELDLERGALEQRRDAGSFFWLDVRAPTSDELAVLGDVFGLHALPLEDSLHLGQRPKLELYEGFAFVVLFGHEPDEDDLVEVHLYVSQGWVITVHRDRASALRELQASYDARGLGEDAVMLLHRIADALVDSFFPALGEFEDRLELIEDDLVRAPKEALLRDVFTMRRRLARLRRVLGPQRDVLGRLAAGTTELPGLTPERQRYFRDVYDHLLRLNELMEVLRDLMASAVDVYLSASSIRMNDVIKQLTVIAAVFLPLTFVTGYFGQNFVWLVENVAGGVAFLVLGVALPLVLFVLLVVYFRRHGWF